MTLRFIFSLLFLVLLNLNLKGQTIEWEVLNVGLAMGIAKNSKGETVKDQPCLSFGTSLKTSFDDDKLYVGVDFALLGLNGYSPQGEYAWHQFVYTTQFILDYKICSYKRIEPFAGLGLGVSYVDSNAKSYGEDYGSYRFVCSPRCGIKFRNIQLTSQYNYSRSNAHFSIKLGYCLTFSR